MIKKVQFIFLLICIYSYQAMGQKHSREHSFAVKHELLGYLMDTYNFSFEYSVTPHQSVQLVLKLFNREEFLNLFNSVGLGNEDKEFSNGFSLGGEYRFYPKYMKPYQLRGEYISPYLRYFSQDKTYIAGYDSIEEKPGMVGSVYYKRTMLTGGIMYGYQRIAVNSAVGFDAFVGVGYRHISDRSIKGNIDAYKEADSGLEIRLGFNIVLSKTPEVVN